MALALPHHSDDSGHNKQEQPLTNQIALFLGILILASVGFDIWAFDGANLLFLGKKFLEFTEWIAFWR